MHKTSNPPQTDHQFATTLQLALKSRTKLALVIKICVAFIALTFVYSYLDFGQDQLLLNDLYFDLLQKSNRKVDNKICDIPKLDPFDPTVMKYMHFYPRLKCYKIQPELFQLKRGKLIYNRSEASNNENDLKCHYRCIFKHPIDDCQAGLADWVDIDLAVNSTKIACEISHLQCQNSFNSEFYENFFYQIIPKSRFLKSSSNLNVLDTGKSSNSIPNSSNFNFSPNVILIGIDSISRSHFIRSLPKTYKFLMEKMGGLDFLGLNKVGENTVPNMIPFLTGHPWGPKSDQMYNDTYFDEWPLIWKKFASAGYVTLEGEDFPQSNLFTAYNRKGFLKQPVDHYMRPFFVTAKGSSLWRWSSPFCLDMVPHNRILTNAVQQMFEAYPFNQPKFALLFAAEISHQDFNDVTQSDDDWLEFLISIKRHLDNSFLIFYGDHGYRFGRARQTLLGQTESRLPAHFMTVPKWFPTKYPRLFEMARINANERLTTFYDAHATVEFIAEQRWLKKNYKRPREKRVRGIPFFETIPRERTCADALIPEEFCVCQHSTPVPVDDARVVEASNRLLLHINLVLLKQYSQICAHLEIINITSATVTLPNQNTLSKEGDKTNLQEVSLVFDVMLTAAPSLAVFQGKVQHFISSNVYTVMGEVERLNVYGNQSSCVGHDRYATPFCFCIITN